jgi:hypothetical protein
MIAIPESQLMANTFEFIIISGLIFFGGCYIWMTQDLRFWKRGKKTQ